MYGQIARGLRQGRDKKGMPRIARRQRLVYEYKHCHGHSPSFKVCRGVDLVGTALLSADRRPGKQSPRPAPWRHRFLGGLRRRGMPASVPRDLRLPRANLAAHANRARATPWRKSLPCISTTTHISCSRESIRSPILSPSVSARIARPAWLLGVSPAAAINPASLG
jgi:hypothetical protein